LALEVPEIDLILGGHDHIVYFKRIDQTLIIKSGCNFNEFNYITLDFSKNLNSNETLSTKYDFNKYNLFVEKVNVGLNFEENYDLKIYVDELLKDTEKQMKKVNSLKIFIIIKILLLKIKKISKTKKFLFFIASIFILKMKIIF